MLVQPEKLPDSLQIISCYNNQITKINFNLRIPKSLKYLNCKQNMLEEISLKLLIIENFNCDNKNILIQKSAENILKKGIKKIKYKKYILQWIICKKLININLSDCSFIIAQYI